MKVTRVYREDLAGKRFGRLTVLELAESRTYPCGTTHRHWLCRCDCGNITIVSQSHLKTGMVKSCGCLGDEARFRMRMQKASPAHKRLRKILNCMKDRCYNPNYHNYDVYGGRGIGICDEWMNDPSSFEKWALSHGYADDLEIDRIDTYKGYSPENCRWVTHMQQMNNTRSNHYIEYDGERLSIADWTRKLGINRRTITRRIEKGLPIEKALER